MATARFSYIPSKFVPQIDTLDNLQLTEGTPPNTKKYQDWHWTQDESEQVTEFRKQTDEFWALIGTKRNCPPGVKDDLNLLIVNFMNFDHGKIEPHHLLNKIADFGSVDDCRTVGIKAGTVLAKAPEQGSDTPVEEKIKTPVMYLRQNLPNQQLFAVRDPDAPDSRALPKGMRCARVFRFIGKDAPTSPTQYVGVGNAKRGLFLSKFDNLNLDSKEKLFSYHYACYETTRGELLLPGVVVVCEIFVPSV
ncbi:MAG: hypothetical protein WCL06_12315 [Bacteroidota bacterium]